MSATRSLGVGFAGAGPVTQAIHLPTLAHLPDLFTPACVMDVNVDLAASVAASVGARHTGSLETLLAKAFGCRFENPLPRCIHMSLGIAHLFRSPVLLANFR